MVAVIEAKNYRTGDTLRSAYSILLDDYSNETIVLLAYHSLPINPGVKLWAFMHGLSSS
jgi:hypothetical protein